MHDCMGLTSVLNSCLEDQQSPQHHGWTVVQPQLDLKVNVSACPLSVIVFPPADIKAMWTSIIINFIYRNILLVLCSEFTTSKCEKPHAALKRKETLWHFMTQQNVWMSPLSAFLTATVDLVLQVEHVSWFQDSLKHVIPCHLFRLRLLHDISDV